MVESVESIKQSIREVVTGEIQPYSRISSELEERTIKSIHKALMGGKSDEKRNSRIRRS